MGTLTADHRAWLIRMADRCADRAAALMVDPHPSAPVRAAVLRTLAQGYRAKILGLAPVPPRSTAAAPPPPLLTTTGEQLPLFEMTA